jgi:hypothetical protein
MDFGVVQQIFVRRVSSNCPLSRLFAPHRILRAAFALRFPSLARASATTLTRMECQGRTKPLEFGEVWV